MNLPCHTTCALHAHESDKAIEAEIEVRETELLKEGGDCYPLAADNLSESFGMQEISFYALIADALKNKQHELVCSLIMNMTNEYWEKQAEKKADKEGASDNDDEYVYGDDWEGRN